MKKYHLTYTGSLSILIIAGKLKEKQAGKIMRSCGVVA